MLRKIEKRDKACTAHNALSKLWETLFVMELQRSSYRSVVPNLSRLAAENYILRHPVANPYNFASRFDDSLKCIFNSILKNALARGTPGYCK